jgi:putative nucleotidyltransferase-like protein
MNSCGLGRNSVLLIRRLGRSPAAGTTKLALLGCRQDGDSRVMNHREFKLLLCCARTRPDVESVRNLIRKNIDWPILLKLAAHHCVLPMLLQTLKSVCWASVPEAIQVDLVRFHRWNAQKNLILTGELLRLLDVFKQNGIPIAAFKGPLLAESVYGDLSLREFSDLDVIVHETDLCRAENILTSNGYQADFPDREYRSTFLSYQGQYAFRHPKTGMSVDLHWRLSSKGVRFPLHSVEMWARLDQVTIAGRTIPTLTHQDLALFLAAHGTKEGWRSLVWVCDFAELLRKYQDIDWAAVLDRAQRSHSSRALLLAIALAFTLLDAPAPKELVDKAHNNSAVKALADEARLRMLRTISQPELDEFLETLNTHDRLSDRLWRIVTHLTTRTVGDYEAMPLPKWLWGFYYLTRPFRLASKMIKIIFGTDS